MRNPSHRDAVWNRIKIKSMESNAKCHTKNEEKKSMFVKNAGFPLATFVSTTSMLEKLIVAVSNVIQQHIPNIINQQQVLNLSKPKQAVVELVQTSSIRLEQVKSANQNSFFLSAFSSNFLCCQNELLLVGNFTKKTNFMKIHEKTV